MQRLPRVTLWSSAEVTRTIPAVLLVDGEVAADSAVGADGVGPGLAAFVPGPGPAHVIFGLEHQGACGTDADAVTAIDTSRVGQWYFKFCGNVGGEAPQSRTYFERLRHKLPRTCSTGTHLE